jgi:hypothetical protein
MADEYICNDKEICKKCIYYDEFYCRNKVICVNNSEYRNVEIIINAIINQKEAVEKSTKKIMVPVQWWTSNNDLITDINKIKRYISYEVII